MSCDRCEKELDASSKKRFKAKFIPNMDLCMSCFRNDSSLKQEDYFELDTQITEDILHYYHACNFCKTEPIWGVRYSS